MSSINVSRRPLAQFLQRGRDNIQDIVFVLLLGILSGAAFRFWRRHRKRR